MTAPARWRSTSAPLLAAALVLGAGLAGAQPPGAAAECAGTDSDPCPVELPVYVGWRVFREHCAVCHGANALGSSFAPDLTRRAVQLGRRRFVAALDHGYLAPNDPTPPRGANPDVATYYGELWAYLSGRASGAVPPGRLAPLR